MNDAMDPLVRVRNLEVSFRIDRDVVFEAVKRVSFDHSAGHDGGTGRRIGERPSR